MSNNNTTSCSRDSSSNDRNSDIKETDVEQALKAKYGDDVVLKSWETISFLNPFDNYAANVTSVRITYTLHGITGWTSMIVKFNSKLDSFSVDSLFSNEGTFYKSIVPEINKALKSAGQNELKVPKCYYYQPGQNVIYLEDLRDQDFEMVDIIEPLESVHINLILKELAKLHAGSIIFQFVASSDEQVKAEYPTLHSRYYFPKDDNMFTSLNANNDSDPTGAVADIIEKIEGFKKYATVVRGMDLTKEFGRMLQCTAPLKVNIHGDIWKNNVLFKYNEAGQPIDIRLIDLQGQRMASPALDLSYIFYVNYTRPSSSDYKQQFFSLYLSTFNSILAGADVTPLFTIEDLWAEYEKKWKYGPLVMLHAIQLIFSDISNITIKTQVKNVLNHLINSNFFKDIED